jgi:hypothetical protein
MSERSRLYELSWDAMDWLAANRWRGRVVVVGTILLVPFVIAALNGSSMFLALKLAGAPTAVVLFFFGLRDAGVI